MGDSRSHPALTVLDSAGVQQVLTVKQGTTLPATATSPIGDYLRKQGELSAVHKFAQLHEDVDTPLQEKYYRDLLPVSPPEVGQQYAFEVDLDKCTGCKACVTGCNSLNGLEPSESWRDVGLLHDVEDTGALKHVTTACHHCLEPACASGCPVDAYVKVETTGIVKHLDDQCIGCQYCTLMCPYDVPKFSKSLGIVRKCDMCSDRLAEGEAPACVQSCPTEAISIRTVSQAEVTLESEFGLGVSGAPPSGITFPTTSFRSKTNKSRSLVAADYVEPQKQHEHAPLMVMLVLTQVAAGVFGVDFGIQLAMGAVGSSLTGWWGAFAGLVICVLALGASIFHLGRPHYAFRAVLGLKHSWLSREILAFGIFVKMAVLSTAIALWDSGVTPDIAWLDVAMGMLAPKRVVIDGLTVAFGALGVFCSVMVYHATRRIFWRGTRTGLKFFLTSVIGGASVLMAASLIRGARYVDELPSLEWLWLLQACLIGSMVLKLGLEASIFAAFINPDSSSLKRTARLHWDSMRGVCMARLGCGVFGGIVVPMAIYSALVSGVMTLGVHSALALIGLGAVVLGELLERYLFFTAVVALKMPGGIPG